MASTAPRGAVIDIDGVLVRSGHPIPGAADALRRLISAGVPICYCTNSCGMSEATKAKTLADELFPEDPSRGELIRPEQMVLSHTPAVSVREELGDARVLVVGTEEMVAVVRDVYGFSGAVHATAWVDAHPEAVPVRDRDGIKGPLSRDPAGCDPLDDARPIAAVFCFQEPSSYMEALQVIVDVVRFGGLVPLTDDDWARARRDPVAWRSGRRVPVYVANPDLTYQARFPVPRFTMGAFVACLKQLYAMEAGGDPGDLEIVGFGKPLPLTYAFVQRVLESEAEKMAGKGHRRPAEGSGGTVFAVGDNPVSDIAGCNAMGDGWCSILTRTGVFVGEDNDPVHPAKHVVADFAAAVDIMLGGKQ